MKTIGVTLMVVGLGIMAALWGGQSPAMGEIAGGSTSDSLYAGGIWTGLVVTFIGGAMLFFKRKGQPPKVVT
jgi:hypothetical protein